MSFRVSALVAALAVIGAGSFTPVAAQPQAPIRPRYSSFGNVFSPRPQFGAGNVGQNQPFMNPIGPQAAGLGGPQAFVTPGQTFYPQNQPLVFAVDPQLPPTGVVGSFNNRGHWYPGSSAGSSNLGHWYPNGLANGRGVLGSSGGGGYAGGGALVGPVAGGGGAGALRQGGSIGGTALGVGAAAGMLRR